MNELQDHTKERERKEKPLADNQKDRSARTQSWRSFLTEVLDRFKSREFGSSVAFSTVGYRIS